MHQMPRTLFDKLPASGVERGICISNFPSTVKASAIKPLGLFAFGSLNGNVNLSAGNHYQQTGSNVTAGHADATGQFVSAGDINITAKDVDIVAGQDTYATDTVTKSKQSGLTVAVNVPIVNAVMAVADTAQTVGQSKNSRVNAMSAANTAMAGYQAANALSDLAKSGMDSVKDLNVSASITVGSSQSKSETHAKGTEAVASNVVGKNVNITATGAGKDSNIHVIGSEIAGTHTTTLKADNNVTLESAQSTSEEHSSNKSSGWNAGVAIGTQGIGFTFGGNKGKGHGDGTSVTQVNSHVGSSTGTTTIVAGDTTTLAGAQVLGSQVNIDTHKLNIESRQDTAKYDSKQKNISGQATIGAGASVSGSYSNSKINADYASVNEQSGILAGDGGYHINVKDHTDLKGGIITSTQAAEDAGRNQMSTGTLTASNIQNHADYDASGFGISGGVELGKAGSGGTDKDTGKNLGVGTDNRSLGVNKSLGYGADDGHNASTTVSGINTANLTITNTAGQAQLMGKPANTSADVIANEVKQSIATATTTDQVQANSGAIANNFDKDAVQSEIDLQIKVTQQFDTTRQQATSMVNTKIDSLKKELETAKTPEEVKAIQDKIDNWQLVGLGINSIAAGLSAPTNSGLGIVASAATPTLQFEIGQYFKDNKVKNEQEKELVGLLGLDTADVGNRAEEGSPAHLLAQTLLAAASAYAGGNNGLMAGLATGAGEAFTPTLSNWLYGKPPQELSADQKQTLSNIVGLGAVGFTASMGGSGTDIANSASLAQIGVEENRSGLSKKEGDLQASDYCRTHPNGAGCKPNQVSQAYQITVKGMMNLCAKDHSVCSTQIEVAKGMLDKTTNSAARGQILNYIQAMQGIWDGSPTAQLEYAKRMQDIEDKALQQNYELTKNLPKPNKDGYITASGVAGLPDAYWLPATTSDYVLAALSVIPIERVLAAVPSLAKYGYTTAESLLTLEADVKTGKTVLSAADKVDFDNFIFSEGLNITPRTVANNYRYIGANGTFVTERQAIESVIGNIPSNSNRVVISQTQARALENQLGLLPNSLENRNILSIVDNILNRTPRPPTSGNTLFLGEGQVICPRFNGQFKRLISC